MALAIVTITQRARGVYLINGSEDEHGTDSWEACSTLAKAKAWGEDYLSLNAEPPGQRPKWQEIRREGYRPMWTIESEWESKTERELREYAEEEGWR